MTLYMACVAKASSDYAKSLRRVKTKQLKRISEVQININKNDTHEILCSQHL